MFSQEMIHSNGKIKSDDKNLAISFKAFGFDINNYNSTVISNFLKAKISFIRDAKDLKGKVSSSINLNSGIITHNQKVFADRKLFKNNEMDFIKSLRKTEDLIGIQTQLNFLLNSKYSYTNTSFSIKNSSNELIVNANAFNCYNRYLEEQEHYKLCILYSCQKAIIEHYFMILEAEKAVKDFKEKQNKILADKKAENQKIINEMKTKQLQAISALKDDLLKEEQDILNKIEEDISKIKKDYIF